MTEMLCVIVVLILVSGLLATAVRLGSETFRESVSYSEAQLLCSSLKLAVSDELRYAGRVENEGESPSFFSRNYGFGSFDTNDDGQLTFAGSNKILGSTAYPYGMRAEIDIDYTEIKDDIGIKGLFDVTLSVKNRDESLTLAESKFQVKQVNYQPEDEGEEGTA